MRTIVKVSATILLLIFSISINAQNRKHTTKAGSILYQITIGELVAKQNTYFKDYGKELCIEAIVDVAGQKGHIRNFNTKEYRYTVDMINQTYVKNERIEGDDLQDINSNFEYYEENGMATKIGTEEVMGKTCDVYIFKNEAIDCQYWIYDNLVLKMNAVTSQGQINYEAIEVELSNSESRVKSVFEIPEGFKEVKANE